MSDDSQMLRVKILTKFPDSVCITKRRAEVVKEAGLVTDKPVLMGKDKSIEKYSREMRDD
jgi:hypothetical protein